MRWWRLRSARVGEPGTPDARPWISAATLFALFVLSGVGCGSTGTEHGPRHDHAAHQAANEDRDEVAERGRDVMPFDLDRTTHRFGRLPDGGKQTVVADDARDRRQVALVRAHLREEAARFRRGDFTDPARIHGGRMPGLAELREGAGRIAVRYEREPSGASLRYATGEPRLVAALHAWFLAQVRDHGRHAQG